MFYDDICDRWLTVEPNLVHKDASGNSVHRDGMCFIGRPETGNRSRLSCKRNTLRPLFKLGWLAVNWLSWCLLFTHHRLRWCVLTTYVPMQWGDAEQRYQLVIVFPLDCLKFVTLVGLPLMCSLVGWRRLRQRRWNGEKVENPKKKYPWLELTVSIRLHNKNNNLVPTSTAIRPHGSVPMLVIVLFILPPTISDREFFSVHLESDVLYWLTLFSAFGGNKATHYQLPF